MRPVEILLIGIVMDLGTLDNHGFRNGDGRGVLWWDKVGRGRDNRCSEVRQGRLTTRCENPNDLIYATLFFDSSRYPLT